MRRLKLNISESGKRTFTTEHIPVTSDLGRKLIFGKDANAIVQAVRLLAKTGEGLEKVPLMEKIKDSHL